LTPLHVTLYWLSTQRSAMSVVFVCRDQSQVRTQGPIAWVHKGIHTIALKQPSVLYFVMKIAASMVATNVDSTTRQRKA
jgi:hypothetical protein